LVYYVLVEILGKLSVIKDGIRMAVGCTKHNRSMLCELLRRVKIQDTILRMTSLTKDLRGKKNEGDVSTIVQFNRYYEMIHSRIFVGSNRQRTDARISCWLTLFDVHHPIVL
jgi:hypothetical protein